MIESSNFLEAAKRHKQPRAIVTVNDIRVKWTEIETVTGALFFIAGSYDIDLPLNGQPTGIDLNFLVDNETFLVKIYIGFPRDPESYSVEDLTLLMVGESNEVTIDPLSATISIRGRDLTSRLIDTKVSETFSNKTGSQIAEQFANEHGFQKRITTTHTIIGNFSQTAQTLVSDNSTQWDVLVNAAQASNSLVFVDGEHLVFEPLPTPENAKNPYILTYRPQTQDNGSPSFNGMSLSITLNNIISGKVSVRVNVPYSYQNGDGFSVVVRSKNENKKFHRLGGRNENSTRKYVYTFPGLTREQATQRAQSILEGLTLHGTKVSASIPGTNDLRQDSLIRLEGTNSALDQVYYPDQITRNISIDSKDGYVIHLTAKNRQEGTEFS